MNLVEQQRREYLQAMGITQYVPRWILPGAKLSARIEAPVAEPPSPEAEPLLKPAVPTAPRVLETVVTGLVDALAPTQKSRVVAEEKLPAAARSSEMAPRFSLSVWRPSAALMVVDTRPDGQALPTDALLHNILRAKGIEFGPASPDVLRWPPLAGQGMDTWAAAREMTMAFLQVRLERQPASYLWLMGENAYRAAVADDRPYVEALGQALNLETLGTLALVLPSLSDMLRQPHLKAITWSAIRPHHVR
jgi:hypothetical protein